MTNKERVQQEKLQKQKKREENRAKKAEEKERQKFKRAEEKEARRVAKEQRIAQQAQKRNLKRRRTSSAGTRRIQCEGSLEGAVNNVEYGVQVPVSDRTMPVGATSLHIAHRPGPWPEGSYSPFLFLP